MRLSIRNQLDSVVVDIVRGEISGGLELTAITREGAQDLGPAAGDMVTALVKSTDISVGVR